MDVDSKTYGDRGDETATGAMMNKYGYYVDVGDDAEDDAKNNHRTTNPIAGSVEPEGYMAAVRNYRLSPPLPLKLFLDTRQP